MRERRERERMRAKIQSKSQMRQEGWMHAGVCARAWSFGVCLCVCECVDVWICGEFPLNVRETSRCICENCFEVIKIRSMMIVSRWSRMRKTNTREKLCKLETSMMHIGGRHRGAVCACESGSHGFKSQFQK